MIYFTNQFAKLWSIDKSKSIPRGRITTSEKNLQEEWVNSSWFASFIGKSKEKALDLEGDERIKILKGKVTNTSKKLEDRSFKNYLNVVVFDFEFLGESGSRRNHEDQEYDESSDEEIPF